MPESQKPRPFRRGYDDVPDNWEALLHVPWGGPVVVEVGCGTGEWICREARQNPGIHYIGIEQTEVRSGKLLQSAEIAGLSNLIGIRADAVLLLDRLCPPVSVDAFYFFYPNPYLKARQSNRRLLTGPSMWVFDRCLKPGGKIYLATNIGFLAEETAGNLHHAWGYSVTRHSLITSLETPRTAFERKYHARGEPLFEVVANKPL